jgi:nitrous oxidase accessory protein NosD
VKRLPASTTLVAALLLGAAAAPAHAFERGGHCSGFIDAIPAVITTPGVWCMRANLVLNYPAGIVIDAQAPNITIDCDGFQLKGTNTRYGTSTGIGGGASGLVVRNCRVANFRLGIGARGRDAVIEENRIFSSKEVAMIVSGDGSVVRGNVIDFTGYYSRGDSTVAIRTDGVVDILDNLVHRVYVAPYAYVSRYASGIVATNNRGGVVAGNILTDIQDSGDRMDAQAIRMLQSPGAVVRDNAIAYVPHGVSCDDASVVLSGNDFVGVEVDSTGCTDTDAGADE